MNIEVPPEQPPRSNPALVLKINDIRVWLVFETNPSAAVFIEKSRSIRLKAQMEKEALGFVGTLPFELPQNPKQISGKCGDFVLLENGKIALLKEEKTGTFTSLAHTINDSVSNLEKSFQNEQVEVRFCLEWPE